MDYLAHRQYLITLAVATGYALAIALGVYFAYNGQTTAALAFSIIAILTTAGVGMFWYLEVCDANTDTPYMFNIRGWTFFFGGLTFASFFPLVFLFLGGAQALICAILFVIVGAWLSAKAGGFFFGPAWARLYAKTFGFVYIRKNTVTGELIFRDRHNSMNLMTYNPRNAFPPQR